MAHYQGLEIGTELLAITNCKMKVMKKQVTNFIGLDVSKHTLDVALIRIVQSVKQPIVSFVVANTAAGLKKLITILKEYSVPLNTNSLFVIENTGLYHRLLFNFCIHHQVPICIENAAQIKWSLGISRGKNDKVDARRIASYAYKNRDELHPTAKTSDALLELRDLLTIRERLLKQMNQVRVPIKEMKGCCSKEQIKKLEKIISPALKGLKQSLLKTDKEILTIIQENKDVKEQYGLLLTIPGIGKIIALHFMCYTNGFTTYRNGKQLASYAGVVPFEHSSGISIKGRNRVHKMANKDLKRLLHMSALSCIRNYPEFKDYYERKKSEGKHAMSVLNAIRNKIVLRVAAVIKNQKPYINNYVKAA